MRTVVLGPRPAELDAVIARRHALGLDTFDEVWEGDDHLAPAAHSSHGLLVHQVIVLLGPLAVEAGLIGSGPFNLGDADDFRVPDAGYHRVVPSSTFVPTAAIAVEVVSPYDETWQKLGFYAAHEVDELLIVTSASRRLLWLVRDGGEYRESDVSRLLGAKSTLRIDWPDVSD